MNKKNYFKILRDELKRRNVSNVEDIIEEYDDLIYQKMKEGKSEDEAVRELGSIEDLANSYGNVNTPEGKEDYAKFILLQFVNLIIGFAIIGALISLVLGFGAIIISLVVVSTVALVKLLTGAFVTISSVLMVLTIVAVSIFLSGLFAMLIRLIFIITYNYVLYNINLLKKNKIMYKKVRIGKVIPTITAVSLLFTTTLAISAVVIEGNGWKTQVREVVETVSVSIDLVDGNRVELLDDNIVVDFDEVKNLNVDAPNIIVQSGDENKIEANHEFDYKIVNETLIIEGPEFNGMSFFSNDYPEIVITVKDEFDLIEINAVNGEIYNVLAKEYNIDAVNLYMELNDSKKEFDITVDAVNLEMYLDDLKVGEMKIDAINTELEFGNVGVDNFKSDTVNLDFEISDSNFDMMDIKKSLNVDVSLEGSTINTFYGKDYFEDVDLDDDSKIKTIK